MELQYSPEYNPIGLYGCYFISLGAWAETLTQKFLTTEQTLSVYVKAISQGHMSVKCFIKKPDIVLNYFLQELKSDIVTIYIGWWNKGSQKNFISGFSEEDIDFRINRHKTPTGHHFRTDGFDPGPKFERDKEMNGHRYFSIVR